MENQNLKIIGTSHIAKQSINEIKNAFEQMQPDIVALELDRKRFIALTQDKTKKTTLPNPFRIGFRGFLFSIFGRFVQQRLGKQVGVEPGEEMLTAIKLAKKNKRHIALIDRDIELTMRRFSKAMTWKERFRIASDVIKGIFFKKKDIQKLGIESIDISKVPSSKIIKLLLREVKTRYPGLYRVLVEERNLIMANSLRKIMEKEPDKKVLAIVGAGHLEGIEELLKHDDSVSYTYNIKI